MDFCPAATTFRLRLLQRSSDAKIMVRLHCVLTILQFVLLTFFRLICYFCAISQSVISQPTDGFLPRRRRRPLAFITIERRHIKNGENTLYFDDFTVCFLTFFQLNGYFRAIARSLISQPTYGFSPRRRHRPLAFITIERRHKNNGENTLCFDNFTVCFFTLFQLN